MPGITGFFTTSRGTDLKIRLDEMVESLSAEDHFTVGTFVDEEIGVYVGWTAHRDSFADCMPVVSPDGRHVLIFSGETLANEELGVAETGDAKCLLDAYRTLGEGLYERLNGRFHGLMIDRSVRSAQLFNDRFGLHRICVYESGDTFYFSGEAKAILRVCPETREIDYRSLGEFFSLQCILQNRTFFPKINVVPGGSLYTYRPDGSVERKLYFDRTAWEELDIDTPNGIENRVAEALPKFFSRYVGGPRQVGLSLTGGLDTRLLLAHGNPAPGELPCYTFGGLYRDCYDVKVARTVAAACRQPHTTLGLDKGFLDSFPELAERVVYSTDGNLELSGTANLYVNRKARAIAPVRLSGTWGSEVLRRYRGFKPSPPEARLFSRDFLAHVNEAAGTFDLETNCHPLSFVLFKQAPWYQYGRLALEQTQVTIRSPYLDNDLLELLYQAPAAMLAGSAFTLRLIERGNPRLRRILTDRAIGGNNIRGLFGLVRLYREFLFKMDYYYNHGMPQLLARVDHAFSFLNMEKWFLGRHKYYHLRIWFKNEWADYLKEILLDPRTRSRPFVVPGALEAMLHDHTQGTANHTAALNLMLTTELMHRMFIDRPARLGA